MIPFSVCRVLLGVLMLAKQYRLVVVVAAYFGHFITYCRQLLELWEQYNDLNTKINSSSLMEAYYDRSTQQESIGIHKILETKFFYRKFAWSLNSFFHEID
ncbi:hypothetical protein P5V15_010124 [Pogonomyrmex californicus]